MANPHKGEVAFEAEGVHYTLRFSADAVCNLEEHFDKTLAEVGEIFANPKLLRMKTVRAVFAIGLRDRHPDLDDAAVTRIFKSLLSPDVIRFTVLAFNRAFGADDEGGEANPQEPGEAQGTTGPAS
jgi:hypothetical protein